VVFKKEEGFSGNTDIRPCGTVLLLPILARGGRNAGGQVKAKGVKEGPANRSEATMWSIYQRQDAKKKKRFEIIHRMTKAR